MDKEFWIGLGITLIATASDGIRRYLEARRVIQPDNFIWLVVNIVFFIIGICILICAFLPATKKYFTKRTTIKVKSKTYNNRAVLEVKNYGEGAVLTAKAKIVKGEIQSGLYNMCWEPMPVEKYDINKNEPASILVAEVLPISSQSLFSRGIFLYKMSESGKQAFLASSPELVEQHKLSQRYPTMFSTAPPEDECVIEITLTANPALAKPFCQRYLLMVDHAHGDKLIFNELPPSGKEYGIIQTK